MLHAKRISLSRDITTYFLQYLFALFLGGPRAKHRWVPTFAH